MHGTTAAFRMALSESGTGKVGGSSSFCRAFQHELAALLFLNCSPTLTHPALTKFLNSSAAAWRMASPTSAPVSSLSLCASCKVSWLKPGLCFMTSSSRSAARRAAGSGESEVCRACASACIVPARSRRKQEKQTTNSKRSQK